MALTLADRVVLFDYGEVISRSPSAETRAELLRLAGVPEEAFWPAYWDLREELDRGTYDAREYWRLVAEATGASWSPARVQELYVTDLTGWITVDPAVVDVIVDLHEGGTRLALLSNAGFDFASYYRFSPLGTLWEQVFVSAEMGKLKPDADIYLEAADELDVDIDRIVFIDNKAVNIDAAVALGMTGHVFTDADRLRAFLADLAEDGRENGDDR